MPHGNKRDTSEGTQATPRQLRERAGISQVRVGVATNTSDVTVRLYEADPEAVKHQGKRESLTRFYARLAAGEGVDERDVVVLSATGSRG